MARYRAKTDGFVNGERVRVGAVFIWNGKPSKWMEPLDREDGAPAGEPKRNGKPRAKPNGKPRAKPKPEAPPAEDDGGDEGDIA